MSKKNISLAKEFPLPQRQLMGTWQIMRPSLKHKKMIKLPFEEIPIHFDDPQQVHVHQGPLDRVESHGFCQMDDASYNELRA